jgi:hypothetical protein
MSLENNSSKFDLRHDNKNVIYIGTDSDDFKFSTGNKYRSFKSLGMIFVWDDVDTAVPIEKEHYEKFFVSFEEYREL